MIRLLCIIGVAFFLLCSCNKSNTDLQGEKEEKIVDNDTIFQIATMPTLDCLPILIIQDSLCNDSSETVFRAKMYDAQMDCDTAIINRKVKIAVSDVMRIERLKRRYHLPLTYITETNVAWKLIVGKKTKIKKIAELSDKTIGMTRYSATDYFTNKVVKEATLKYPAYKAQINSVFVRFKMLENEALDAVWLSEPLATAATLKGHNVIFDSKYSDLKPGVFVGVGTPNENDMALFVSKYNKATDLINKNGLMYYAPLISKYMQVDTVVINSIPKIEFKHISPPNLSNIQKLARDEK